MSLFATTMLDMIFRVSTLKKSKVKMLVKTRGLRSWIFSGKKFEDSLIFRIKRGGGTRGWVHVTILSHLLAKKGDK